MVSAAPVLLLPTGAPWKGPATAKRTTPMTSMTSSYPVPRTAAMRGRKRGARKTLLEQGLAILVDLLVIVPLLNVATAMAERVPRVLIPQRPQQDERHKAHEEEHSWPTGCPART